MTLEKLLSNIEERLNEHHDCCGDNPYPEICTYIDEAREDVPRLIFALKKCIEQRNEWIDVVLSCSSEVLQEHQENWINRDDQRLIKILQGTGEKTSQTSKR